MKGIIAFNTQHTGFRGHDHKGYAVTMTKEQVDKVLAEPWLKEMVAEIRNGDEKKKDKLPFICPHYSAFKNNHRAQADIIPEAFTYMTCVDVDEKELVDKAIKNALAVNHDEYSDWKDQVLRMEYSARKKLHIYIRIPKGMTIEETQQAFCKETDIPYDESCITPERFIFVTGIDEEIYRSPQWLEPLSEEELAERKEAYLERGMDQDGRPLRAGGSEELRVKSEECFASEERRVKSEESKLPSVPVQGVQVAATPRTRYIFNACMKECELKPKVLVVEGARHEAVKSILSVGAAQLLKKEEFNGALSEMMPDNWNDKNIQDLVNDFYTKYTDPHQKMTQFLRRVFAKSQEMEEQSAEEDKALPLEGERGEGLPPQMPTRLPKLIQLLVSRTPDIYKPAVAHAVFPALATHLWRTRFRYIDNKMHEATLMNVLMAGTGAGKDCISEPIDHIMADIRKSDAENMKREKEWKDEINAKGANKDKKKRPEGLVIQEIDADMTNPAFVMRMAEADEHFLYVKLNEIDQFDALKGNGSGGQQFRIMCLAFDPNNRYGQTRIGTQSVTERVCIRFNWNATTTIQKGQKYFARVLTDGPLSRINFCTIPEREIGSEIPVYGDYDEKFDEELKPYIERLCGARGEIDCPQAFKLAKKLNEECAEFSRLSQSRTYENFTFRANVIAYLKACVLFVANDYKWDKTCEDFIRWSLNYDLWCKMQFFGDAIEQANNVAERRNTRGPRNLLEMLPDTFTIEDAKRVRRQQGLYAENAIKMVRNWKSRNYVYQISDISFQKRK